MSEAIRVALQDANEEYLNMRNRIVELEAALRPFVFGDAALEEVLFAGMSDDASGTVTVKLRDIRRARNALPK